MAKLVIPVASRLRIRDNLGSMPEIHVVGGMNQYVLSGLIGEERGYGYPETTVQLAKAKREQAVAVWERPETLSITWGSTTPGSFGKFGVLSDLDRLAAVMGLINAPATNTAPYAGPTSTSMDAELTDRSLASFSGTWNGGRGELYYAIQSSFLSVLRRIAPGVNFMPVLRPSAFNNPGGGPMPGAIAAALRDRVPTPDHVPIRLMFRRHVKTYGNTVVCGFYGEVPRASAPWLIGIDNLVYSTFVGDWGDYATYAPPGFEGNQVAGYAEADYNSSSASATKRRGVRVGIHPDAIELIQRGVLATPAILNANSINLNALGTATGIRWKSGAAYNHTISMELDVSPSVTFSEPIRFQPMHQVSDPFGLGASGYSSVTIGQAPLGPQFMDEVVLQGPISTTGSSGDVVKSITPSWRAHFFSGRIPVAMADTLPPADEAALKASHAVVLTWSSNQRVILNPVTKTAVYDMAVGAGDDGIAHLMASVMIPAEADRPAVTVGDANDKASGKEFTAAAYLAVVPGSTGTIHRVSGTPGANVFSSRLITSDAWTTVEDTDVLAGYTSGDQVWFTSSSIPSAQPNPTEEEIAMFFSEIAGKAVTPDSRSNSAQGEFDETDVIAGRYDRAAWSEARRAALDLTQWAANRRSLVDVVAASYAYGKLAAKRFVTQVGS